MFILANLEVMKMAPVHGVVTETTGETKKIFIDWKLTVETMQAQQLRLIKCCVEG